MSISVIEMSVPTAEGVTVTEDTLSVDLSDGRTIAVPLAWFPRLLHASPKERNKWRLIGRGQGIHWAELDEDISVEGLLAGKPSGESQSSFKKWIERRGSRLTPMTTYLLAFVLLVMHAITLPSAHADTMPPAVGAPAPDFSLTSNEGTPTNLKEYRGKWVVLYFYPKDFTSGCTLEAQSFQRDLAKYEQANAVILGVSVDSAQSHKDFCAKEGLRFKLLSDPDAKVSTSYGSLMDYNGTKLSARNTFIIDPEGKVSQVFTSVKPSSHSEEVLSALTSLQKH